MLGVGQLFIDFIECTHKFRPIILQSMSYNVMIILNTMCNVYIDNPSKVLGYAPQFILIVTQFPTIS